MRLPLFIILLGCVLLSACGDKLEDPFSGTDNYITSFALFKDDITINAVISEDEITLAVPAGFSLSGVTAKVAISENAIIMPDPASISDWESEQIFVVTALNGERRSYIYKAFGNESLVEKSVILETQSDVDAFGQSGITEIKGSLIIGAATGRDSIMTIAPLNSIKRVGYGVTIKSTYANEELDGLAALQTVGRTLRIENSKLKHAKFDVLESTGDIEVESKIFERLDLPKLTEVSSDISFIILNLSQINAPLLDKIEGNVLFTVSDKQKDKSMLQEITFPSLRSIQGILNVDYQVNIGKIDLPELTTIGAITISSSASLTVLSVNMPKLQECKGELFCDNVSKLQELKFPSLLTLGSFRINYCQDMEEISMPELKEVTGDFIPNMFVNIAPDGFRNFTALTSIGGTFQIKYGYETSLPSLTLPPSLKYCNVLHLDDCLSIENIDITGIEIEELVVSKGSLLNLTIKGDKVFKGSLHINGTDRSVIQPSSPEFKMPQFEGIKEVGNLTISPSSYGIMPDIIITGITKVNGDFKVNHNSGRPITTFSVRNITEVTGDITTHVMGPDCTFEFTALQKIGGVIHLGVLSAYAIDCKRILFPQLREAGGVFLNISKLAAEEISMPELTTIAGELRITSPQTNTVLSNLNGFDRLSKVTSVHVENMQMLQSYEGLKNCISSIAGDSQWQTVNNLYNPTLADMKGGKWNKE